MTEPPLASARRRESSIRVVRDVPVAMRDGTILRADVWRPDDTARHPALLQRLPYDKSSSFITAHMYGLEPLRAVEAGFAVVVQDARGRYQSDGVFRPFLDEASDGADTIAWIAAQPFSDGRICMYGGSYVGATQLLTAAASPPGLRAIAPNVTSSEFYDGWTYQGGAFQLGFALYWALASLAPAELSRREREGEDARTLRDSLEQALSDPWSLYSTVPLTNQPLLETLTPAYLEWLAHSTRDGYWSATAVSERYRAIRVPGLHIGGWSDVFLGGTLTNYVTLRQRAGTPAARAGQRLIVGPWSHGNPHELIGEIDFGPPASQLSVDFTDVHLRFFRTALGDAPVDPAPVRLFVMGRNAWRDEEEWPLGRAQVERLHLRSSGRAGTSPEDGALGLSPPEAHEPPDVFVYDPSDPVPTAGGATLLPGPFLSACAGFRDQRSVERRDDVLVYTSAPLLDAVEITGPIRVILEAASSAADTDWTAKLVDVLPDGRALNVVDGILRARYRHGFDRAVWLEPDRPTRVVVELGATSIVFAPGHRLRLEISSSNFPRFDRNPNHGGDCSTATLADFTVAFQTVFHDRERPSYIELPRVAGSLPS